MTTSISPDRLNEQHGIPHVLRFEAGPDDMARAVVTGETSTGVVYLHGAHVAEFEPVGHKPLLFMSRRSHITPGRPIRGGVPICFPWFGKRPNEPNAPAHGLARTRAWDFHAGESLDGGQRVALEFITTIEPFELLYRVELAQDLTLTLRVTNTGPGDRRFEQALHTYFSVSDVRQVEIAGLAGTDYLDETQDFARFTQPGDPLTIDRETDRLYLDHPGPCTLRDPGWARAIHVEPANTRSTVVWNPWKDRAAAIDDLGDEEWMTMLCVETGNIADNAIDLPPGGSHEMATTLRLEPLT